MVEKATGVIRHRLSLLIVLIPLLLLNLWFDYHHHIGYVFDVAILVFFIFRWSLSDS
jgi:hypothetical protein